MMRARRAGLAGVSIVALVAAVGTALAQRPDAAFDPLLANGGAVCGMRSGGARPILKKLILAQAETKPFKPGQQTAAPSNQSPPLLYDNLGTLQVAVTTDNHRAQEYFDQGLKLAFAFNHAESARAFRAAQHLDPRCAMCYWGEALVLGPNINAPMSPDAVAPAAAAIAKARKLSAKASPPEQALIRALARRYQAHPPADRKRLDTAYADAMANVARTYPDNDMIQVLYAESLMDLSPWDYWEAGGAKPKGRSAQMIAALERVLARDPTHPGAAHYYIHAMEASTHPEKALPSARLLAQQMPGAGHVVHMPSHIYYRIGMYREALKSNVDAIAVDERYFQGSESDPVYRGAYYPHNIHFLMVSALMGGDGKTALEAAAKLDKSIDPALLKEAPVLQPVKAAPYFSHVQFSSPDVLVALPDPGPEHVLVKAMWHYARAVGLARKGVLADSRKEIDALGVIERTADFKAMEEQGVPGRDIVRTARGVAAGRLADASGDLPGAIKAYREAVAVQDALPYMEPPYWYYPVRQSLGVVLLRAGRGDEAEQVFRESLARTPSNGWALRGLIEVYRKRGDAKALAATQKRFETTWLGQPGGPPLSLL
jgi:tetratricopeptide (TPR) repeat protein